MANARIASLEAELSASQKAYNVAIAAKANAEKSQKLALGKAKKAEKALADANKEYTQQEQAMTECLCTMSATAEGKHFALSFILTPVALLYLRILLFSFFPLSSFVVQDLPGYLCRLCNRAMILC
jgi:hypothetical protein